MVLTAKQEEGLKIALQRYRDGKKYTCISGYAGSGKTTLVKFVISAIQQENPMIEVCFTSYTGKAAQVLLKKGNPNVSTLHHLMYESIPQPDGTFLHIPVQSIPCNIIVVDEISMVPGSMWKQLLSYDVYILALGDPFQLPPVSKDDTNDVLEHPHIFLDEVMRQAQDSEIIRLTMDIREGKPLSLFDGNEVKILERKNFFEPMLTWADQILVATNATRANLNNLTRKILGKGSEPQAGDKVICLKNDWDLLADNKDPLINGTIGYLKDPYESSVSFPQFLGGQRFSILNSKFVTENGAEFPRLLIDKHMITTGDKCCDPKTAWCISRNKKWNRFLPREFTYGYAITYWKAQGSEWDKVLVIEEDFPYDRETHARAIYTACTRASEKLVLIKK